MVKRLFVILGLVLSACGGGGSSTPAGPPAPLTIVTQNLGQGNVGFPVFVQLEASGGKVPYVWTVSGQGDPLPSGLSLSTDGVLLGTPSNADLASLIFVAQDANADTALLSTQLEVRDLDMTPGSPGAVDPGTIFNFQVSGGNPSYQFSLSANRSGGSITTVGSYTAGTTSGIDVVRATDTDGFFEEVAVTVGQDPFVGFTADWGNADIWWVDWDVAYDPNITFATDLDEILATIGLRDPASTDAVGTEADQLARRLFIRRSLGHMSTYFGNGMDGQSQVNGLAISIIGPAGPGTGSTPTPGNIFSPGGTRYNSICVRHGVTPGVVGTALLDGGNGFIEHDCGSSQGTALGIFANRVLPPYIAAYGNSLSTSPVTDSDVDDLRSMLLGDAPANSRAQAIFNAADNFGKTVAAVLAHEVGHSLGLTHSSPSAGQGDIMNAALNVTPTVVYAFNSAHWTQLLTSLPGPNR